MARAIASVQQSYASKLRRFLNMIHIQVLPDPNTHAYLSWGCMCRIVYEKAEELVVQVE